MKTKVLFQEILKLIACNTMLIDHFVASVTINLPISGVANL